MGIHEYEYDVVSFLFGVSFVADIGAVDDVFTSMNYMVRVFINTSDVVFQTRIQFCISP